MARVAAGGRLLDVAGADANARSSRRCRRFWRACVCTGGWLRAACSVSMPVMCVGVAFPEKLVCLYTFKFFRFYLRHVKILTRVYVLVRKGPVS